MGDEPVYPILTRARRAVWDAIENWEPLQDDDDESLFVRRYKDEDLAPRLLPAPDQLPALALVPIPAETFQALHQQHEHRYNLRFLLFTESWNTIVADWYWERILNALFLSGENPPSGVSYIQAANGFPPYPTFNSDYSFDKTNEVKIIVTTIDFGLRVRFNPQRPLPVSSTGA